MAMDVYANCRFYVEINQKKEAAFIEMSGLQVELDVFRYEEGGNNSFVHALPGRAKVGNITLKKGLTASNEFLKWCMSITNRQNDRRHISVIMYDIKGTELQRWNFDNAFPVKWSGPQLTADGKSVAIETLELAHDGFGQL